MMKKTTTISLLMVLLVMLVSVASADGPTLPVQQTPPLPETVEAFGLSISYPAGWFAVDDQGNGIIIGNHEEIADILAVNPMPPDVIGIVISDPKLIAPEFLVMPLEDVMQAITQSMDSDVFESGKTGEVMIGEQAAVWLQFTSSELNTEGFMIVHRFDEHTMLVATVATRKGELDKFEDTVFAIIGSITYTEPTLDIVSDGSVNLDGWELPVPDGWVAGHFSDAGIVFANTIPALEQMLDPNADAILGPGEASILVIPVETYDDPANASIRDEVEKFARSIWGDNVESLNPETSDDDIGSYPAYTLYATNDALGMRAEILGVQISDDHYVLAFAFTQTDEEINFRETARTLLSGIKIGVIQE